MDCEKVFSKLVLETRKFFKESGCNKSVLGLSGGIDSALVAKILAKALGSKNVFAISMPLNEKVSKHDVLDSKNWAKSIGINFCIQPIESFAKPFEKLNWKQGKIAKGNSIARLRMNVLYNFANSQNALVAGTGNKTELLLGYFTKYGDGGADVLPIGNLYKTQVIELAKFLKLPKSIVEKKPTAGLWHGQTDEGEIGMKYAEMDFILKALIDKKKEISLVKKEFGSKNVEIILKRMGNAKHKLCLAKVLEI